MVSVGFPSVTGGLPPQFLGIALFAGGIILFVVYWYIMRHDENLTEFGKVSIPGLMTLASVAGAWGIFAAGPLGWGILAGAGVFVIFAITFGRTMEWEIRGYLALLGFSAFCGGLAYFMALNV